MAKLPSLFCHFCSEAIQLLYSLICCRPAHVPESWPLILLQVLQNSGSQMFMFRVKSENSVSARKLLTKSKKKNRECSNIKAHLVPHKMVFEPTEASEAQYLS